MRHSGILAIVAASVALFAVGCGGSGSSGSSTSTGSLSGVWTGPALQTRAIGDTTTLQVEFFQNGTALTGTTATYNPTGSSVAALTGTISGNNVTASVTDGAGGTTTLTGSVASGTISGNYTSTNPSGTKGGTFTLTKSVGVTTPNIAGAWSGTSTTTGGTAKPLSVTFTQSQDTLTFVNPSGGTGTGAIIGNHVTLINSDGTTTTYINGTLSGTTISGTTVDSTGATGAFSISNVQSR